MKKTTETHTVWYFTNDEVILALQDYITKHWSLLRVDEDICKKGILHLQSVTDDQPRWDYSLTLKRHLPESPVTVHSKQLTNKQ